MYNASNTYFSKLTEKYINKISAFECSHDDTNEFLKEDALNYQKLNIGVTYLLFSNKDELLGFVTLGMGAIKLPDNLRIKEIEIRQYPGLKIGRLATDAKKERKGCGRLMIDFSAKLALEMKEKAGCRYLLVDSYKDKVGFYEKLGFKTFIRKFGKRETIPMYMELE